MRRDLEADAWNTWNVLDNGTAAFAIYLARGGETTDWVGIWHTTTRPVHKSPSFVRDRISSWNSRLQYARVFPQARCSRRKKWTRTIWIWWRSFCKFSPKGSPRRRRHRSAKRANATRTTTESATWTVILVRIRRSPTSNTWVVERFLFYNLNISYSPRRSARWPCQRASGIIQTPLPLSAIEVLFFFSNTSFYRIILFFFFSEINIEFFVRVFRNVFNGVVSTSEIEIIAFLWKTTKSKAIF